VEGELPVGPRFGVPMIRIFDRYISKTTLLMICAEGILIALSLFLSAAIRLWGDWSSWLELTGGTELLLRAGLVVVVTQTCLAFNGLYDLSSQRHRVRELACVGQSCGGAALILVVIYLIFPDMSLGRGIFFLSAAFTVCVIALVRNTLGSAVRLPEEAVLILGTGSIASQVIQELNSRHDLGLRVVGFLSEEVSDSSSGDVLCRPVLGNTGELGAIVERERITKIIVAMQERRGKLPISDLVKLRVRGIAVEDAQSLMAALTGRVWLSLLQPSWFVFSDGFSRSRVTAFLKRALDITLATVGLTLSFPLMVVIGLLIRATSPGPFLYRQVRVGRKGETFELLKFRSMREDAEAKTGAQWASNDDPRSTAVGKYLRKYRLDELPQFWNIIRGQMSFVGPRPERPVFVGELRKRITYYDERHSVRPGLTGWAQVRFHYGGSMEDAYTKLEYDLFYLKQMSIVFDCVIVLLTVRTVLQGLDAKKPKVAVQKALASAAASPGSEYFGAN
jgi:sugar transferase (PEP-CTERM system associated)